MKVAELPFSKRERLKALNDYYILDSLSESDFDGIVLIAAAISNTPANLVCLVDSDRQWIKSRDNSIEPEEICNLLIANSEIDNNIVIISNTIESELLKDSDFIYNDPKILFFAQIPLISKSGDIFGALCVLDIKPGNLNNEQKDALNALAEQIVRQLELRKKISELDELQIEQKSAYSDLEKFSFVASHDLKSPLHNIISLTQLLRDDYASQLDESGREYIDFLNNAALQLADLVSAILDYSKSSQILVDNKENINIPELITEVKNLLHAPENIKIIYNKNDYKIFASRIAMKQILLNLCDNAIKHNDRPDGEIEINFSEGKNYFTFEIKDNGPGIADEDQERIFELFERIKRNGRKEKEGTGVGLSIVKRLVEKSGGEIKVISEIGKGTTFIFTIRK